MASWRRIEIDPDRLLAPTDEIVASQDDGRVKPKKDPRTRVTIHLCPHAAGEPATEWYNCKSDPRAQYEER